MDAETDNAADLRRSVRDMIALTALPASWIGQDSAAIARGAADMLLTVLDADLVYVTAQSSDGIPPCEALRINSRTIGKRQLSGCREALLEALGKERGDEAISLQIPAFKHALTALIVPFGHRTVSGHIAAATWREGFPDAMARSLCQVAANQAAVALQEADMVSRLFETIGVLQTITDNADACYFLLDDKGRCKFINPAAERLFGYSLRELRGKSLHEVFHYKHENGCPFPEEECVLADALASRRHAWDPNHTMIRRDGAFIPVQCVLNPVEMGGEQFATVVEIRDLTEVKRLERARAAERDREGLLAKINLAIRSTLDRAEIERTAVVLLGDALRVERAAFVHLDMDRGRAWVENDWRAPGLASLAGEYPVDQAKGDAASSLFGGGKNLVVRDCEAEDISDSVLDDMRQLGIRAAIDVPLHADGKLAAIIFVASAVPRNWSNDEITLVEGVAAQTRTAIEAADTVQREHRIAAALQAALMPSLPTSLPGLAIKSHYQAALQESSIGGDFSAIYRIDDVRYALIIGDVSGKGLLAASQVAAIQNMLRFAICASPTLSSAISDLNRVAISQDLLIGFATMFVGIYDSASQLLTYISCGHEPALMRATDGDVVELINSGPPLGVAANYQYPAHQAQCAPGDALLLYTDGVSEAGPDRKDMLGHARLASLLRECDPSDPSLIINHILAGAQAHAHSAFHDDVCIVAVVVKEQIAP